MSSTPKSVYDLEVEKEIVNLLSKEKVAFRNEIKYRLERGYYHTVTDYAVIRLEHEKAYNQSLSVERTRPPGRPRKGLEVASAFYYLPGQKYEDLVPLIRTKVVLSSFISSMSSYAGTGSMERRFHRFGLQFN
jgi:hypothetical protein